MGRVVAAIVGAAIGFALGALFWSLAAPDGAPKAWALIGSVDAVIGAFGGWHLAGRRRSAD
ncbi:MAG: hypothetical protein AAGE98_06125 [Actinomycetota bacterium]